MKALKRGTRVRLNVRTIGGFKGECIVAEDQQQDARHAHRFAQLILVRPGDDPDDRTCRILVCRHQVSVCRRQGALPTTAGQFADAVRRYAGEWVSFVQRADEDDRCRKTKTVFHLAADIEGHAHVEMAHGRLIVCFDHEGYHFDLSRLHESFPEWSWQKQIASKAWRRPEHLALLAWLYRLFPIDPEIAAQRLIQRARRRAGVQAEG